MRKREQSSQDARISYISERYRDADTTLRTELAALPGTITIISDLFRTDTPSKTPEQIDSIAQQANRIFERMDTTVLQVVGLLDQTRDDIEALQSEARMLPDVIHSKIRSLKRFFENDSMQEVRIGLLDITRNPEYYGPVYDTGSALCTSLHTLEEAVDSYLHIYTQSL
jgi:hypothetical protein